MSTCVDRCSCEHRLFAELVAVARAQGWDLQRLARETGAGTHCGLCVAYLRRALETGETAFRVLLEKEAL